MNWGAFVLGLLRIVADKITAAFSKREVEPPTPPPRPPGFDAVDEAIDRKLAEQRLNKPPYP